MDSKKNKVKKMYISSVIALILAATALIGVTFAWFFYRRELDTLTWKHRSVWISEAETITI